MRKIYLLPIILISFSACKEQEVRSSARSVIVSVDSDGKHEPVPQEVIERNRRMQEELERERADQDNRLKQGEYDRFCARFPAHCRGWSAMPTRSRKISSSALEQFAAKLSSQEQIPMDSARVITRVLVDLSAGNLAAFERIGLNEKIIARLADGGALSKLDTWNVSQKTGLSSDKVTYLLEKIIR